MLTLKLALLIVCVVLQALDYYTTYRAISSGKGKESNPVVKKLMDILGISSGLLLAKALEVGILVAGFFYVPYIIIGYVIVALAYTYVVYNNYKIG